MRAIERKFIYVPERTLKGTPEHLGLAYEDVRFQSGDGVPLHGWWVPGASPVTWLFCHGNGGNISARLDQLLDIHRRLRASVFIFDYRGYGLSGGAPSDEDGTHLDAVAAYGEMRSRLGPSTGPVVFFGRSMGAAVAARLATEIEPSVLVLECPPPSIPALAYLHASWTKLLPLRFMMRSRYETARHVRNVRRPVLVVQGADDRLVPAGLARQVYDAANAPKQWLLIAGAGHDRVDLADPDLYYGAIQSFVARYAGTTLAQSPERAVAAAAG